MFIFLFTFIQITGKTRNDELKAVRREFVSMEARANALIKEFEIYDQETFELHFLASGNVRSIRPLFLAKIAELESTDQISTAEKYKSALSVLTEFGGNDLTFGEITEKWLNKLRGWYTSELRDKEGQLIKPAYTITSLGYHLRNLRHIYKRAISKRLVTADQYPFGSGRYVIQTVSNSAVEFLDPEAKDIFIDYRSSDAKVNYYHDFWRLSYYCNGANFKDLLSLKRKDYTETQLSFDRLKTVNTDRVLKKVVVPIAQNSKSGKEIVSIISRHGGRSLSPDSYIFPVFDSAMTAKKRHTELKKFVRNANRAARKIAKALDLPEDVTTYTARHTYSNMMLDMGASTEMLQDSLGHGSASTTEAYKGRFSLKKKMKFAEGL